jgi:large subunit ribosomal protein L25
MGDVQMERVELQAQARAILGKQVKQLRLTGLVPAVLYGPDTPAKAIQIEERPLFRALQEAGSTTLIDLYVDEGPNPDVVLAREVQRNPITGQLEHVDFYQVRLTEKVKITPRLEFVGESPLAKTGAAVVIHGMNEVEVECLPTDLIHTIRVDLSSLETLDDAVLVSDLLVPPGITVLSDPTEVVVSLVTTRAAAAEGEEEEGGIEGAEAESE